MIKEISRKAPKAFDTAWSFQTINQMSSKQLIELLLKETGVRLTHIKTKRQLKLEVLRQLNSSSRKIFNNPDTVTFKKVK